MKNLFCFCLILLSLSALCQKSDLQENQPSKWRVGGGVGLGFGSNNYFGFAISPFVGYEITPQLEAGVTAGYQYSKWSDAKQNVFNAGPYLNYYPIPSLFTRIHYEYYTGAHQYDYEFGGSNKYNFDESALWMGAGYRNIGKVQCYAGLMYNVLYKEESSLFSSGLRPILGVSFGF